MDFFDKLGDTLINAGKDVSKKAKDLSGTAKLNMDIKSKEDFIQKQYTEIGRLYYEAHSKEADAEFAQQMAIVTEAYEAIAKMRDEVLKIKGVRVCPNCGSPVPDNAGFCGKCGTPLNQMPPQQGAPNMPQNGAQSVPQGNMPQNGAQGMPQSVAPGAQVTTSQQGEVPSMPQDGSQNPVQ